MESNAQADLAINYHNDGNYEKALEYHKANLASDRRSPNMVHFGLGPLSRSKDFRDRFVSAIIGCVELKSDEHTVCRCITTRIVQAL